MYTPIKQCVRDWSGEVLWPPRIMVPMAGRARRSGQRATGRFWRRSSVCTWATGAMMSWVPRVIQCSGGVRVCVPGAGLGRLAFDIAQLGFSCQGNEWSAFMLLAANIFLNPSDVAISDIASLWQTRGRHASHHDPPLCTHVLQQYGAAGPSVAAAVRAALMPAAACGGGAGCGSHSAATRRGVFNGGGRFSGGVRRV